MMSSWVQLLLVVLAACPLRGVSEGDPLPAALVELVRNNPISSIEDLQLLLLSDSVDEDDGTFVANGGHRLPRSLDAQPAQQALCKVRTEVVEVTRAMLDRSNANFLLWPPCVEVQRCSGCCNTKSLQCVPFAVHTRYLQVMKIEYINKRPTYAKAVVSVVDHVECRCQSVPRSPVPKKKSPRRQHGHQHRNQTLGQEHRQGQVKVHSKDELHQWDELKHNQRSHLEDLLEQHWSPRGDTFTQPGEGYSVAREETPRTGEALLLPGPHWAHNSSRLHGTRARSENPDNVERKDVNETVSSVDNVAVEVENKLVEGGSELLSKTTEGNVYEGNRSSDEVQQTHNPSLQEDKFRFTKSYRSGVSQPVTENPQVKLALTVEKSERDGSSIRPSKEPNPEPRDNETPEEERNLQIEEAKLEEERKELLLLHRKLDQEKEILRQQQMKHEEEGRQKEMEADSRHHLPGQHHHVQTTTQKPETTTSTTTTRKPSPPAGPRPPARPHQTRRKMRKNRKRISKAAMRAMLM